MCTDSGQPASCRFCSQRSGNWVCASEPGSRNTYAPTCARRYCAVRFGRAHSRDCRSRSAKRCVHCGSRLHGSRAVLPHARRIQEPHEAVCGHCPGAVHGREQAAAYLTGGLLLLQTSAPDARWLLHLALGRNTIFFRKTVKGRPDPCASIRFSSAHCCRQQS